MQHAEPAARPPVSSAVATAAAAAAAAVAVPSAVASPGATTNVPKKTTKVATAVAATTITTTDKTPKDSKDSSPLEADNGDGGRGGNGGGKSNGGVQRYTTQSPALHDVLFGRGRPLQRHPGNLRFHRIVNQHRPSYQHVERAGKIDIVLQVLLAVAVPEIVNGSAVSGGRFLKSKRTGFGGGGGGGSKSCIEDIEDGKQAEAADDDGTIASSKMEGSDEKNITWVEVPTEDAMEKIRHALRGEKTVTSTGKRRSSEGSELSSLHKKKAATLAAAAGASAGGGAAHPPTTLSEVLKFSQKDDNSNNNDTTHDSNSALRQLLFPSVTAPTQSPSQRMTQQQADTNGNNKSLQDQVRQLLLQGVVNSSSSISMGATAAAAAAAAAAPASGSVQDLLHRLSGGGQFGGGELGSSSPPRVSPLISSHAIASDRDSPKGNNVNGSAPDPLQLMLQLPTNSLPLPSSITSKLSCIQERLRQLVRLQRLRGQLDVEIERARQDAVQSVQAALAAQERQQMPPPAPAPPSPTWQPPVDVAALLQQLSQTSQQHFTQQQLSQALLSRSSYPQGGGGGGHGGPAAPFSSGTSVLSHTQAAAPTSTSFSNSMSAVAAAAAAAAGTMGGGSGGGTMSNDAAIQFLQSLFGQQPSSSTG